MRSRLSRLAAGLLLVSGLPAMAEAGSPPSVDVYGVEIPKGATLPSGDLDLPPTALPITADHAPLAPTVQAIPTPTAFHAGAAILSVAFLLSRSRRREGLNV